MQQAGIGIVKRRFAPQVLMLWLTEQQLGLVNFVNQNTTRLGTCMYILEYVSSARKSVRCMYIIKLDALIILCGVPQINIPASHFGAVYCNLTGGATKYKAARTYLRSYRVFCTP